LTATNHVTKNWLQFSFDVQLITDNSYCNRCCSRCLY